MSNYDNTKHLPTEEELKQLMNEYSERPRKFSLHIPIDSEDMKVLNASDLHTLRNMLIDKSKDIIKLMNE